jgi:hypothetical protein
MDTRVEKGKRFVELIWWSLAKRIVRIAGDHYQWTEEEWKEAMEQFLRPGDYKVLVK